ncbi:hypothetical protein I5535_04320 [Rhodobacteraceae bacterium F11138]|nr:hypothetical protein [Rhodobacteraceae bacterium F11138]
MRLMIQKYTGFGLILLLLLTSESMAVARGAPGPGGQIELCTGTGPVMVYVDENGAPIGAPHVCPDYALTLLACIATPDSAPLPVVSAPRSDRVMPDRPCRSFLWLERLARGPPLSV